MTGKVQLAFRKALLLEFSVFEFLYLSNAVKLTALRRMATDIVDSVDAIERTWLALKIWGCNLDTLVIAVAFRERKWKDGLNLAIGQ